MADFLTAVGKTLGYEGGLVDNPADPGGLTNFGISQRAHPELTAEDIRTMTRSRAMGIYRQKYWLDLYDQVQDQAAVNSCFDFGVTSGVGTAIKILQGALSIPETGIADQRTVWAAKQAHNLRVNFTVARIRFYVDCNKLEFLHSWLTRTINALV